MGDVTIRHKLKPLVIERMFTGTNNKLAANMAKRAVLVTAAAKRNLSRTPRRIDTGLLRASIHWEFVLFNGKPGFRVGTNVVYARYVHDGTGIFGPKGMPITPKHSKVLMFIPKGSLYPVFARSVRGMPPNSFLKDAMFAAKL